MEKNLEYLSTWVDDLANEFKYQQEMRRDKMRKKQKEAMEMTEGASTDSSTSIPLDQRLTSLIVSNQISEYCNQVQHFTGSSFGKLFLAGSLQKE